MTFGEHVHPKGLTMKNVDRFLAVLATVGIEHWRVNAMLNCARC
jgi:hypothetical protein